GADYGPHGGSVPINVKGTGGIGAVTVSGLPQRDDHTLAVEALALMLAKDLDTLRLAQSL
ncbi:heme-binding protein, partial [Rhizobium ruizarguesonis]